MTIDDVKNTLPLDKNGNVFMELYNCFISPDNFIERFSGASLNYDSLYNHENATAGWKNQFDTWHEQGII